MLAGQGQKRTQQWAAEILSKLNGPTQTDAGERFKLVRLLHVVLLFTLFVLFMRCSRRQVDTRNLVGIALCVFVKERLVPFVSDIQGTTVGVGVFGVMVRARVCVFAFRPVVFVLVHLATRLPHGCV